MKRKERLIAAIMEILEREARKGELRTSHICESLRDEYGIEVSSHSLPMFIRAYVREAEHDRRNGYNYYRLRCQYDRGIL